MSKIVKSHRLKFILSMIWFVFTFSMVTWWWIFSLRQLDSMGGGLPPEKYRSLRWMLLWEGSILLAFIFVGGAALLVLINRERLQNQRLRLFFSNFSHDLKTSLSRLRLRTEVLASSMKGQELQELMEEVSRLDLQLENSLWVARGEEQSLSPRAVALEDLISLLRGEWPEMGIHLQKNVILNVDVTAMRSVLRNLFQNAWLHGQATQLDIQVQPEKRAYVRITIKDNGKGFAGSTSSLGRQVLTASDKDGNGIGLYLTKSLLEKMKSQISFESGADGFCVHLIVPGDWP